MSEESRHIKDIVKEVLEEILSAKKETGPFKCSKSLTEVIKEKNINLKESSDDSVSGEISMSINTATKSVTSRSKESYRPTQEQLGMINKTAKEDQSESSGYVFTFQATNLYNRPDRRKDAFSNNALATMANQAMSNTIPFLLSSEADCEDHTWKAINSYGYVFNAYTKDGGLYYDTYVPDNSTTKGVIERIFSGQVNKLSVGFALKPSDVLCSACKTKSIFDDECSHEVGEMDSDGKEVYAIISKTSDNYEISAVAVPCQAEAKITRTLDTDKIVKGTNFKSLVKGMTESFGEPTTEEPTAETVEKSDIGKINNGKNTIEDNSPMDVENQVEEAQVETAAVENVVAEVQTDEAKLCKVAENVKNQAVKEIGETIKFTVDESMKSVFSKLEELEKDLKKVKKSIKKSIKKVKAELEVQATVPGSKTLVDASRASGENPLSAATEKLLSEDNMLGPILRSN